MPKILVIEDDKAIRENLVACLKIKGYKVLCAKNGKWGLKAALNTNPDLIVCDIMMPEMNGYQVAEQIRNNPKTKMVRFVFLTAKVEKEDVRQGMQHADDYLQKPSSITELLEVVESQLDRAADVSNFFRKLEKQRLEDIQKIREEVRQEIGDKFTDKVGNLLNNIAGCFNELFEAETLDEKTRSHEDGIRAVAELYAMWMTYLRIRKRNPS